MAGLGSTLEIDQGRDLDVIVTLTDKAGDPIVVTGSTAAVFQVFSGPNADATLFLSATLGAGVTVYDGAAGQFRIYVAGASTLPVAADGIYHFEPTLLDGTKPPRLVGRVTTSLKRTT